MFSTITPIPRSQQPSVILSPFGKKKKSQPPPTLPLPSSESLPPAPPPPQNWKLPPPSRSSVSPAPRPSKPREIPVDSSTFGRHLRAELSLLKNSIKRAFVLDDEGNVSLGSFRRVEEAQVRLALWIESTKLTGWGAVIHYHFEALATMMKALKGYYYVTEPDYFVIYSLFQSSIISFWTGIQSFQCVRPKRKQINPRDCPLMDLPEQFNKCRNDLVHRNPVQPELRELVKQTKIAYAWYARNFWPKLSFEYEANDDGSRIWWLMLEMDFPKVQINEEKDWLKLDPLHLFRRLAKGGFPEPEL